ncbi:MAG: (Fe-S)-binding protein [Actinobacteria bacterium]|nr:(Fe-S)-binding protein [Actinomycetota bacterium]
MTYTSSVFVIVLMIALALFVYVLVPRVQYLLLGRPEPRVDQVVRRTAGFLVLVFGQKKVLKERVGLIHFFIFWGFIVIAFGTLQVVGEGLREGFSLPVIGDNRAFYLLKDILSVLVITGVIVAAHIRYVVRPTRLKANLEAGIILGLIFALVVTEFFYSGLSYALAPRASHSLAFVAVGVSHLVGGSGASALDAVGHTLWWLHVVLLLSFLVYIPNSKHFHLIACPFNEWLRNLKPRGGQIYPVDFDAEDAESFGVGRVEAFTRKQLLDLYSCAECGRCQDNCPAYQSGKRLSSKLLITKLRDHLVEEGPRLLRERRAAASKSAKASGEQAGPLDGHENDTRSGPADGGAALSSEQARPALIGDVISLQEIWACTTCYSCQEQCPVQNEHINKIIDMRRHLVLMEGELPREAQLVFRNMEVNGNPLGESALVRGDYLRMLQVPTIAEEPEADVLYWPGCAGSLDARNQKVSAAFVNLARAAGVSVAVLGNEEKCCGEAARRLGNEYLYQSLAAENIGVLAGHNVRKIVTQCPHCFNTLKNEYPQLGAEFEVIHHTQFLHELASRGRLRLDAGVLGTAQAGRHERAVYHDSCYLGRYNGVYDQPRELLKLAGLELMELPRTRSKAFCCGAGGGRIWLEESEGERINNVRTDEILRAAPDVVAVACPYCLTMLKDGVDDRGAGDRVRVMDIAEILQGALSLSSQAGDSKLPERGNTTSSGCAAEEKLVRSPA